MDTRQVIARFEAERQALAMMDHPNIARVLDAGTTDTGRPYFVMDLVKGVPITDYCDQQHLPIRQRLELMTHVCHAVQHAHQKGIIHRDLKPSNVLVAEYDGKPVPKIIDFGVAKATAQRLTEKTMFTEYGQLIGTFEYMSPEQARFNQLDVDTRIGHLLAGRLAVRGAGREHAARKGAAPLGRVRRSAADHLRRGAAPAEPAAQLQPSAAVDLGPTADRTGEAQEVGPWRARLDRDEVPRKGPQPALRDGERPGGRPPALPQRRDRERSASDANISTEEVRSPQHSWRARHLCNCDSLG